MNLEPTRIEPALPPGAFQSYRIIAPIKTHWRRATCEEVNCARLVNGWASLIDTNTELGKQQAEYITRHSGRAFKVERDPRPGFLRFTFEPGQECFEPHKVRIDRPELFVLQQGDYRNRGNAPTRRFESSEDWLEDFNNHQEKLRKDRD